VSFQSRWVVWIFLQGRSSRVAWLPVKRKQVAAQVFDRVIDQAYTMPLTSQPHFFTHTAEIPVAKDSSNGYGIDISRVHWAGKAASQ